MEDDEVAPDFAKNYFAEDDDTASYFNRISFHGA